MHDILQQIHRQVIKKIDHPYETAPVQAPVESLRRRTIVVLIGCANNHHTFAWASRRAIGNTPSSTIVVSLCADLPQLHQEAIRLADEVQVLNLSGHIDARTLHELCAAYNAEKPIAWMEDWPMYCPRCRVNGPESEHFFHNTLSLHDLNELLTELRDEHFSYLSNQLANWYGQIVPVVLLPNGLPALQVDLTCSTCERYARTAYAIAGDYGAWVTLVDADGLPLVNLCDADERLQRLACAACLEHQMQLAGAMAAEEVRDGE
jgi:hypothetical protein